MANRTFVCLAAAALLAVAGCGASGGTATEQTAVSATKSITGSAAAGPPRRGPQPVEFQYLVRIHGPGGEELQRSRYAVITDGVNKVRTQVSLLDRQNVAAEQRVYTWDGNRLLEFSPANQFPYTIWEAPGEHPGEVRDLATTNVFLWPALTACTKLGKTRTVIDRTVAGYRCPEPTPGPDGPAQQEIWIDQATGILLASCGVPCGKYLDIEPERLVIGSAIDASTFSTEPPANAPVRVVPRN